MQAKTKVRVIVPTAYCCGGVGGKQGKSVVIKIRTSARIPFVYSELDIPSVALLVHFFAKFAYSACLSHAEPNARLDFE